MKNLSLLFIAFLFSQLTTVAQWTQKTDIPTARWASASCTVDGKIYVIGGGQTINSSLNTMEVFNPFTDTWDTTKTDMPTARVELGACAVNGKIFAIGGANNHGASPLGMVEEYDPLTNAWDTNNAPMPTPRKGAAYGVIDNKIYVAGGTAVAGFTASNKLEIYDPVTDEWVDTLATMIIPIYEPEGAVIDDKFYVIGGLLGYPPWTGQKIVQMYDPTVNEWFSMANLDSGRVGHTTNVVSGKIYAIGGDRQPPIVRNVEEYEPNLDTWNVIASTPSVIMGHTASVFENKIYVFSGTMTFPNLIPSSAVYSFDPSYLDTIKVPGDYTTIQEAIDAAMEGNVVLVAEGTYYENINFKGKAITVASHFLVDGNESHIENTIIDGSQPTELDSASVVTFRNGEDTNSVICGFTITGGTGTIILYNGLLKRFGGGVFAYYSDAKIQHNIIESNNIQYTSDSFGGGICGFVGNYIIENNIIRENEINTPAVVYWCLGGGIYTYSLGYVRIENNKILNNVINAPEAWGGGIIPAGEGNDNYFILNNLISGNTLNATTGGSGGIDIFNHSPTVKNNVIVNNSAPRGGGAVIENATPRFSNNTIAYNTSTVSGGGLDIVGFFPQITCCILWGNSAPVGSQINGNANVDYSDIQGGGFTGPGNIDLDPLFRDTPSNDFHLQSTDCGDNFNSPCIDAGDPAYRDSIMDCDWGLGSQDRCDMGAYSIAVLISGVFDEDNILPDDYVLFQNYPNPFNPATTIKYGIKERTFVELKVYDMLGREVTTFINEEQDAGFYEIEFNASTLASGVYFYRIQAGEFVETKKMLLLK